MKINLPNNLTDGNVNLGSSIEKFIRERGKKFLESYDAKEFPKRGGWKMIHLSLSPLSESFLEVCCKRLKKELIDIICNIILEIQETVELKDTSSLVFRERVLKLGRDKRIFSLSDIKKERISMKRFEEIFLNISNFLNLLYPEKIVLKPQNKVFVNKSSRYVVVSYTVGCPLNLPFYLSIERYCKLHKAQLLIIIIEDPSHSSEEQLIDKRIYEHTLVEEDLKLNTNCLVSGIKLQAKQLIPLTGLKRVGSNKGTVIFGSPKQSLEIVPVQNNHQPRAIMTTGSITLSSYETEMYQSKRTSYLAKMDHINGAVIVEVISPRLFNFRHIIAENNGEFIDNFVRYGKAFSSPEAPRAFVLGDLHIGSTNNELLEKIKRIMIKTRPQSVVLHDTFDGSSVNPHEGNQILIRSERMTLKDELTLYKNKMIEITQDFEDINFIVVKSNHDEFLDRYLESGTFIQDFKNTKIGLELSLLKLNNTDVPLLKIIMKSNIEKLLFSYKETEFPNINFLTRDSDYFIEEVQIGCHGDKTFNGIKGQKSIHDYVFVNSVIGHSHTPSIYRGVYTVGTFSELKLGYNKGSSNWMHSFCVIYKNGIKQLINVIPQEEICL